jgi:hypothetical protein
MNTRTTGHILMASLAATLVACAAPQALAPAASAAPVAAAAPAAAPANVAPVLLYADFGKSPAASNQGASMNPISYSEKKGDSEPGAVAVAGDAAVYKGRIGNAKGSQWAGTGFNVSNDGSGKTLDLTAYKAMKIKLSSPTVTSLRIRISADDSKIGLLGCYPVYVQTVSAQPTEYTIPFTRFSPEEYCAENSRSMKATVGKVTSVEVIDTANTRNKPTEFSVGKIEFLN